MQNTIKELVKKHFNLVEATEQSFGEISTADGELTLSYEGDELAQGLAIFVVTPEGNIPAPDGEHMLEGDITIVTADGKIEAIKETEAPAEEELEEEIVSEEMAEVEEEKMEEPIEAIADAVTEEVAEEVSDAVEAAIDEEIVSAVAEAVKEVVEEMTKEMEERMAALEGKFNSFSAAPASEKTIASSFSKKSKEEDKYKNASAIEAMIARKTKRG
jgi:hypothetical protein